MEAYSVPDLHSTCRGTGAQGRHCGPQLSPISSEQLMEPLTGQRGRLKGKNWPPSQLQRAGSALRSCKNTVFGLKDVQSRYALGHSQQDRDRVIQRSGQNHIQKMKTKMNTHWVSLQFQNIVEETQQKIDIILLFVPHTSPTKKKKKRGGGSIGCQSVFFRFRFFSGVQQAKTQTDTNFHLASNPVLCPIILSISLKVKKLPIK